MQQKQVKDRIDVVNGAEDDETFEYFLRPSIIGYLVPIVVPFLLGFVFWAGSSHILGTCEYRIASSQGRFSFNPVLVFFVISTINAIAVEAQRRMAVLALGAKSLYYKQGIIFKSVVRIRYCDIRNMRIDRNLLEELFGIGSIAVATAGTSGYEAVMKGFEAPERIMDYISHSGNRA